MDEFGRKALLFDVYGPLLTQRQQEIYDLVHSEDMSLGEVSENLSISRQAVHDMLRRTNHILEEYEKKLGLAEKFMAISSHVTSIRQMVTTIEKNEENAAIIVALLAEIDTIDALERR